MADAPERIWAIAVGEDRGDWSSEYVRHAAEYIHASIVSELADDLADELRARYGATDDEGTGVHPAMRQKFDRDMDVVRRARHLRRDER